MQPEQYTFILQTAVGSKLKVVIGEFNREVVNSFNRRGCLDAIGIRVYSNEESGTYFVMVAQFWEGKDFDEHVLSSVMESLRTGAWCPASYEDFLDEFETLLQNPELTPALCKPAPPPNHYPVPRIMDSSAKAFSSKRMEPIQVSITDDNYIILSTGDSDTEPPLRIHKDQADVVCQWLKEAKATIEGTTGSAE